MSPVELNQLRIVLVALLPKDGSPMTVSSLAAAAGVHHATVTNALYEEWFSKRVDYAVETDSYRAIKQGDGL